MFIKQLKYDLMFSRNAFLGMGALLIGMSIVLRMGLLTPMHVQSSLDVWGFLSLSIAVTVVSVASVVQIFNLYNRSFFKNSGYLMLTLPVNRTRQLASKLIVSLIWYNFMMIVASCMILIFAIGTVSWNHARNSFAWHGGSISNFFEGIFAMNVIAFLLIAIIFFGITLANSVIGRWHVHGFVAGVVAILYLILTVRVATFLDVLFLGMTRSFIGTFMMWHSSFVYYITFLGFAFVAVFATLHLLKNRVDLR
ncbi:MAG: hypothetical protein FWC91_08190 [Defluviitaleaceae bacterium]|nr:hypothetical protein [Defluviitaleaceae bacterium]